MIAPKEISLDLSEQEQRELVNLLDIAVKAGGLGVAQNAVYFLNKLKAAPKAEPKPEKLNNKERTGRSQTQPEA
jgi:hypothetical protein